MANEAFSHLSSFFRRYYNNGDFLSLRRYKNDTYAIPYEGEEVKLHWANADQYYIKTSEYLRDYAFKLFDGKRAHFKLVDATEEKVNALPHDNVVASSSSSGSGGGSAEISGALQSEIQKAVSSYKKGISESTLDTEKMIKLLEALKAHRKPADKVAAAQA